MGINYNESQGQTEKTVALWEEDAYISSYAGPSFLPPFPHCYLRLYVFIYNLFKDTVSNSGYLMSNGEVKNE